ncbi:MAG: BrnA antitoxin family protein [Burkholderiales bacterium]|nr:BrnA antitoxin family protein [Burkholderiales bacterium]
MIVRKPASRRTLGSDLKRVDAHVIKPEEYEELPELTDEMFERTVFKKAGRPKSVNPKQMISLRLPPEVVARWKATGPGWQTRMAKRLEKLPLPRATSDA